MTNALIIVIVNQMAEKDHTFPAGWPMVSAICSVLTTLAIIPVIWASVLNLRKDVPKLWRNKRDNQ